MKIRNGFVSNSSSSSFIIGIVNSGVNGEGRTVSDLIKDNIIGYNQWAEIVAKDIDENTILLMIDSFNGDSVSCKATLEDKILYVNGTGPDDDDFFYDGDYCDYDKIDLDDFENNDQSMYYEIASLGGEVSYGAGRNG